ncbi:DHHC palmitoyltransferase-domain-containing protein [Baffinella frigidus]|nr:DHHC palmitoyltransferase-domain-containing protein [Cryptophyta sp. CCMP2293]
MALDIVDWAIVLVGLTMLPMLPDLLGNILIAFLPDSYVTASVRRWSAAVRRVSNTVVSRFLVVASIGIPPLALYFQPIMLTYRGDTPHVAAWYIELAMCGVLMLATEAFYFLTLITSPGFLPMGAIASLAGAAPCSEDHAGRSSCKKCGASRPPRAHHCSTCNRCVLRMDHHCPFTNCCVGLFNERWFVGWLACVWAGTLYGCSVAFPPFATCVVQGVLSGVDSLTPLELSRCAVLEHACFVFLPALGLFLFLSVLLTWHLLLMISNQTTIEFFRFRLEPFLERKSADKANALPSYSTGSFLGNVKEVLFPVAPRDE